MGILFFLLRLYEAVLLARVLLSWIQPQGYNKYTRWIYVVTEPVLAPLRRILPFSQSGFDFSPVVALIVISIIKQMINGHF
jgi:YggT family protein